VSSIGARAFTGCERMRGVYFLGNAPSIGDNAFDDDDETTIYYLAGTKGWGVEFGGRITYHWRR